MQNIDKLAADLQRSGRFTENEQLESGVDYSEQAVRMATVHAREDMVLVVSYMSGIAKDVRKIQQWVSALGILALVTIIALVIVPVLRH